MQHRVLTVLTAVGFVAVAGCDAGSFTGTELTETGVTVTTEVANLAVSGVSVEITGPGIDSPIITNLPINSGVASGQVSVLAGADRAFMLRAFDAAGLETHRGGDTVDIAADASPSLNVSLTPLVGNVAVGGQIGDYTITVTLPSTTMAAGGSAQAQVTVVDAYGDTISSPGVSWGSSNPGVATITSAGVINALVAGQTTIGAAYRGFGGSATLTVQ